MQKRTIPAETWRRLSDAERCQINRYIDQLISPRYLAQTRPVHGLFDSTIVRLCLLQSAFAFTVLAFLPSHPLSMPLAYGLATIIVLALLIILRLLRNSGDILIL